jgi:dihydroorotase
MFDLIITGGTLVSEGVSATASLAVRDGRIAAILAPGEVATARRTIDATGMLVLPGLVDAHVHFREPGLTHKEDFASGSAAAAAGGVTTVMVMPTDNPMTTTPDLFAQKRALAEGRTSVDFALQALLAADTSHVRALADMGAVSFEMFLGEMPTPLSLTDTGEALGALEAARDVGVVVGVTPGDDSLVRVETERQKALLPGSREAFSRARPPVAEALGVARACLLARHAGAMIHLRQISCAASVSVLRHHGGGFASAEATPHNLLLDEGELIRQGPTAKVVPPLRPVGDVRAVQGALADGLIDMVATDHAPHAPEEKAAGNDDIFQGPGGFPGVQTLLPSLLDLVGQGVIGYPDLVRVACEAPARRFGLFPRKGSLRVGGDADVVIVDPSRPFTVRNADQMSKAQRTPFDGRQCPATPVLALLRGAVVMRDGRPEGPPQGRFLAPSR